MPNASTKVDLAAHPFHGWWTSLSREYTSELVHYALLSGTVFLILYVIWRRTFLPRKIQSRYPGLSDVGREILWSLLSIAVFAGVGLLIVALRRMGYTRLYLHIDKFGWGYLWISVLLLILAHDTWFYWIHRLMHWRPLYKLVHEVHHRSRNPTPWAAYSFHPAEAILEGGYTLAVVFLVPVHPLALSVWLLYMIIMNVLGHSGFEFMPRGFAGHGFFRWINTSVHHNMHHHYYNCNYGLYFNIWDRLMNTNHVRYEEHFDEVVSPGKTTVSAPDSMQAAGTPPEREY